MSILIFKQVLVNIYIACLWANLHNQHYCKLLKIKTRSLPLKIDLIMLSTTLMFQTFKRGNFVDVLLGLVKKLLNDRYRGTLVKHSRSVKGTIK